MTACLLRVLAFLEAVMEDFLTEEAVLLLVVLLLAAFSLFSGWLSGSFGWLPCFSFYLLFGDMSGSRTLLACFEAWAIGVKGRVVKSKAQSVIEIRFIRATERPSVKAGLSCLRLIYKT